MRSHTDFARSFALAALLIGCICFAPSKLLAQSTEAGPSETDISAAIDTLRADPNLSQERKARTLRWSGEKKPQEAKSRSGLGRWFLNFFVWLGQLSRVLVWVLGGLLALLLIVLLYRLFKGIEISGSTLAPVVPTHVRDLDIRPESLPDDIGGAALELWGRGEHRAALALLYRGLLSRLAHVHGVPIRDSTTEGDCLALASRHLPDNRRAFVARLIRTWQQATYGGHDAQADEVRALCADFAAALAPAVNAGRAQ